jgi:membrane protease YdiL (CAAX protease family)
MPAAVAALSLVLGLLSMATAVHVGMLLGTRSALLLGHAALLAPFLVSAAALRLSAREAFALRAPRAADFGLSVVCGLGLWLGSAGLLQLQYTLWPAPPEVLRYFESLHAELSLWPPWSGALSLLAIAVWPAIVEETAFRGALLGSLRRSMGDMGAVLASATLFAIIHIPPGGYRVPFTLALGLALGALRLRTGSIVPGIVAHAVLNATTVVLTSWLSDQPEPTVSLGTGAAILLSGAMTAAVASAFIRRQGIEHPGSTLKA